MSTEEGKAKRPFGPRLTSGGAVQAHALLNKPGLEFASWKAVAAYVHKELGIVASEKSFMRLQKETGLQFAVATARQGRVAKRVRVAVQHWQHVLARLERIEKGLGLEPLPMITRGGPPSTPPPAQEQA